MKRRVLLVCAACLPLAGIAKGASAATAVEAFKQFVGTAVSASGTFTQSVTGADGKPIDMQSRGEFVFKRPGKFVWNIAQPYPQKIVSDGKTLWIWDPDLNQVTMKRLNGVVSATPAAVLFGTADADHYFKLIEMPSEGGLSWVKAEPKENEDAIYESVSIGFDPAGVVAAMRLKDHFGQTTELKFADFEVGVSVDEALFDFKLPEGADVLRDDN